MKILRHFKWVVAVPAIMLALIGFGLMLLGVGLFSMAKYLFTLVE